MEDGQWLRQIKNSAFVFKDDELTVLINKISTKYMKKLNVKDKNEVNPYIGSFDTETFLNNGESQIYSLGFTNYEIYGTDKEVEMFYLGRDGVTSEEIVIKCLESMLKYSQHTYYTHNLGNFDAVYLLKIILEYNKKVKDYFDLKNIIYRNEDLLKFEVSIPSLYKTTKIIFVDSYNLLANSLSSLAKQFGIPTQKGYFPYNFVNKNTLNYIGVTPGIEEFKGISKEEYTKIYRQDWNLKEENLEYLKKDLLSLYEIMKESNKYLFINHKVQMTDSLTISGLAMKIFCTYYLYNNTISIINKPKIFNDLKLSYYGGIVEVYKPYGENLKYYDVNSLYPFVAKNKLPLKLLSYCEFLTENLTEAKTLSDRFGFFKCRINTRNVAPKYLGLLPIHYDSKLIMPHGEWEGWYFSEEVKFAEYYGYEVTVLCRYVFDDAYTPTFNKYVDNLFKIKSNSQGSEKLMTKFFLNSLLGRFGLDIEKPITTILTEKMTKELLIANELSFKKITDEDFLVTYNPKPSLEICEEHGVDYNQLLNSRNPIREDSPLQNVNIAISSAIAAYGRIYMNQIKIQILEKGGNIYYTDTDSIVTDIELDPVYVGDKLGQFKLLDDIEKGYFISSKTYCLIQKNGKVIMKAKGVNDKENLSIETYEKLYNNEDVQLTKNYSSKDLYKGGVYFLDTNMTIKHDSYSKREKIFDENNKWIDTKPLEIYSLTPSMKNNLALVLYVPKSLIITN